jgi:hypothetical protein
VSEEPTRIEVPSLCRRHQVETVRRLQVGPEGPWRATIIMTQIALFQACTARDLHARTGGDLTKVPSVGCLACFDPEAFRDVTSAGMSGIKAKGEGYVERAGRGLSYEKKSEG